MKKLLSGAAVLAPMVRCGTLPLRLAVLRHGATFAWGEELVDHKVMHGRKAKNDLLGTTDYYDKNNICFFRYGGRWIPQQKWSTLKLIFIHPTYI